MLYINNGKCSQIYPSCRLGKEEGELPNSSLICIMLSEVHIYDKSVVELCPLEIMSWVFLYTMWVIKAFYFIYKVSLKMIHDNKIKAICWSYCCLLWRIWNISYQLHCAQRLIKVGKHAFYTPLPTGISIAECAWAAL